MHKRVLIILVSATILIGLAVGAWILFTPADGPAPAPPTSEGLEFPTSAEDINWENREIFKSGLAESAVWALDELPRANTYYISLEIPQDLGSNLKGHQIVRYFNAENEDLTEIYFRLFPNFQGGQMTVSDLAVEGGATTTSYESNDTALRVDLENPLEPGESLVVEMDFTLGIPTNMGGNYGLFGYFEDVLVLDSFYPIIPAYDETGWYKQFPRQNGDLTYNDASFYIIQVEAPADLVLASSGVIVNQEIKAGIQTSLIASGPSRDFYLAGSREFVEISEQVGDTLVRVHTRPEYSVNQAYALDFGVNAIQILSEQVGPYPYTEFEIISSPMLALGMEYPGITSIVVDEFVEGVSLYGLPTEQMLESTLAHETGHMWFYNVVGNDQQNDPWVDEALVQYLTYIYYLERYGDGSGYVDSWNSRWSRVDFADIAIGMNAGNYQGQEYGAIVYGRGPLFFLELEKQYGLNMVMDAVRSYYQDNIWGIGYCEEIRAALEESCGCDLSAVFEEWVY
ncbi:MAG: hypothetical protein DRI46_11880 [Chloroflexi bacterium]|nr:MAG: hypothetical protein DRI46_11880 [Chloroflexota bacterium]